MPDLGYTKGISAAIEAKTTIENEEDYDRDDRYLKSFLCHPGDRHEISAPKVTIGPVVLPRSIQLVRRRRSAQGPCTKAHPDDDEQHFAAGTPARAGNTGQSRSRSRSAKQAVSTKAVRWRVCVAKRSDSPLLPSRRAGLQLKRNAAIRFQWCSFPRRIAHSVLFTKQGAAATRLSMDRHHGITSRRLAGRTTSGAG
jgi:hypothetical protein